MITFADLRSKALIGAGHEQNVEVGGGVDAGLGRAGCRQTARDETAWNRCRLGEAASTAGRLPLWLDLLALVAFCLGLFVLSLRNVRRRWIV